MRLKGDVSAACIGIHYVSKHTITRDLDIYDTQFISILYLASSYRELSLTLHGGSLVTSNMYCMN